jgi:DNA-binding NtrC family response regulator
MTRQLLLVDDEAGLVELLKRFLERSGYSVETHTEPPKAIEAFAAEPRRYSVVITDLTLPGISGEELVTALRKHNPDLPAIITSGYPFQPSQPNTEFVQKPFLPKMLAEVIARMLSGAKTSAACAD